MIRLHFTEPSSIISEHFLVETALTKLYKES